MNKSFIVMFATLLSIQATAQSVSYRQISRLTSEVTTCMTKITKIKSTSRGLSPNSYDRYINRTILPRIDSHLLEAMSYLEESAKAYPAFASVNLFYKGCAAIKAAELKLERAERQSIDAVVFSFDDFSEIRIDLEDGYYDNDCP